MVISKAYLRKSIYLEYTTFGWNITGAIVLGLIAPGVHAVAVTAFSCFTLIEAGRSLATLWELRNARKPSIRRVLKFVSMAFVGLGVYLIFQNNYNLIYHIIPEWSKPALTWTGLSLVIMSLLSIKKNHYGQKLNNSLLRKRGQTALMQAILASTVFISMAPQQWNRSYWWADAIAGFIVMACSFYAGWQTWIAANGKQIVTNNNRQ